MKLWSLHRRDRNGKRLRLAPLFALLALALAVVLPGNAHAQGGPPLLTDDPGTPGPGRWEVNVALTTERQDTSWLFESPLLDLNYGWGKRIQLKFELPWVVQDDDISGLQTGLGNSRIGVKWRFLGDSEEKSGFAVSVYPQLSFNNPGPSARHGLVEKGMHMLLPVEFVHSLGPLKLNGEFGLNLQTDASNQWLYGLALGRDLSAKFELIGEIHDISFTDFRENELVFDIGGRRKLTDLNTLLFTFGRSLPGATGGVPHFFAYTGLQFTF